MSVLVFHGQGQPKPGASLQGYPGGVGAEFHHIAMPRKPQPPAVDTHPAHHQQVAALFGKGIVVAAVVFQAPLGSAQVFRPLLLQVDERPLAAAKRKMLDAGHRQEIILCHQESLSQLTPAGSWESTVTV